jgi:hypothetical protein
MEARPIYTAAYRLSHGLHTPRPNHAMKLTITAVRFGETFLLAILLRLRRYLCVGDGSLSFSR